MGDSAFFLQEMLRIENNLVLLQLKLLVKREPTVYRYDIKLRQRLAR